MNDEMPQPRVAGGPTGRWRDDLGLAFAFLTRLPWPGRLPADRPLMAAAWAFPVVGLAIGLIATLGYRVADGLGLPVGIAALAAVAASTLATGALHEDGLADVADGFGGGRDPEAKRRIMRDSRIGSYGVLVLIFATAAKLATLAALPGGDAAAALVASHALGRAAMPALAAWLPPSAADGSGRAAGRPDTAGAAWPAAIATGIALVVLPAGIGLAAALAAAGAALAIGWLAKRQIGGFTGDVFGAAEQAGEIAALLAVTAYLGT